MINNEFCTNDNIRSVNSNGEDLNKARKAR
jgi:hypothetical protein